MEENQIQRYGRQILLREVGGKGQRKLLSRGVHVRDLSAISSVAVEFLAAAGSPITLAPGLKLEGFVKGPTLEAFNADAQRSAETFLSLGSTPAPAEGAAITLGAGGLAFVSTGGCRACFEQACAALTPSEPGDPVTLGSLAALIAQRLILELSPEGWGALRLEKGLPRPLNVEPCAAHR